MSFASMSVGHTHEGMDVNFSMATIPAAILAAEQSADEVGYSSSNSSNESIDFADDFADEGYSGPRLWGTGHCGGSSDEDAEGYDEDDSMNYDSDTPPANTTATQPSTANNTECTVCGKKINPSKNARPECKLRSAKSNMEQHALKKGDAPHKALAEALRAEDCHLDNWQTGRVPPGETRNASNWQRKTPQEWATYIGRYNRHLRRSPEDQQKALNDNQDLRKCITRLNQQWQSGSVQFRHQSHTGDVEFDHEFYRHWDEADDEREQFYRHWEDADKERQDAVTEQEYQELCRHRPPNKKHGDKRMYLPKK